MSMEKRYSQSTVHHNKFHVATILLLICFIFAVYMFLQIAWSSRIHEAEKYAKSVTVAVESAISKSLVLNLINNGAQSTENEYYELKSNLLQLVNLETDMRNVYILYEKDNELLYLIGTESLSSEPQAKSTFLKKAHSVVRQKKFKSSDAIVKNHGDHVAVYVPMKSLAGNIIATLYVEYNNRAWINKAILRAFQSFIIIVFGLLAALSFYFGITWYKTLKIEKVKLAESNRRLKNSEELFRTVFHQAPIGIAILKGYNFYSDINPVFEDILGRSKEELLTTKWTDITHPDDLQPNLDTFAKFEAGEIDRYSINKRYIKPNGLPVWVHLVVARLHISNNNDNLHLCIIENINEYMMAEKALSESERSKSVLLSHLPGMAYRCKVDRDWTMEFVSEGCYALTGYHPSSLIYNKDVSYNEIIKPKYREMLWNEWINVLRYKKDFRYEYEITTATGEVKWVMELGQGIFDENNNVCALEGIVVDITEQRSRESKIKFMDEHDSLTGVYNRKYFQDAIVKYDKNEYLPLSIIDIDINGLRLINDAIGYSFGDILIKETARILKSCCKSNDILSRIGGDEFCMLLPNTDSETLTGIINQINRLCEEYNESQKIRIHEINLSMGFATRLSYTVSLDDVIKEAYEDLRTKKLLNQKSWHSSIISSMMTTVYERSHETEEHAKRLVYLTRQIGKKLDLSKKRMDELELFSMLHDIGKIGIGDGILNKAGELTDDEWEVMKKHPEIGYRIAKSSLELEHISKYILTHHERWDGKGYPNKLKGVEIPLLSRILALADAYDAMTMDRIYRPAMTKDEAIKEIMENSGTQFDKDIAEIFIDILTNDQTFEASFDTVL